MIRVAIVVLGSLIFTANSAWAVTYEEGVEANKIAAEKGDAAAQFNLGLTYEKGLGVTQNYKEAEKWYRLAASQRYADAQLNLGFMYGQGLGVTQDYKEAEKWFRLAALQGNATAQSNLGLMYEIGKGVIQDFISSHVWYNIASANGYKDASKYRDIVANKMTPQQIETAQALARECIANNYKRCE